jgi:hypothetical protein
MPSYAFSVLMYYPTDLFDFSLSRQLMVKIKQSKSRATVASIVSQLKQIENLNH